MEARFIQSMEIIPKPSRVDGDPTYEEIEERIRKIAMVLPDPARFLKAIEKPLRRAISASLPKVKKWSAEKRAAFEEDWNNGKSVIFISNKYCISKSYVSPLRARWGLAARR